MIDCESKLGNFSTEEFNQDGFSRSISIDLFKTFILIVNELFEMGVYE